MSLTAYQGHSVRGTNEKIIEGQVQAGHENQTPDPSSLSADLSEQGLNSSVSTEPDPNPRGEMDGIVKFVLPPENHRSMVHAAEWLDKRTPSNLGRSGTTDPTWKTNTPGIFESELKTSR